MPTRRCRTRKRSAAWAPGTYTVTEGSVSGWTLTSVVVTGAGSFSTTGGTATVNLAAGENVTVRYTNTKQGSITVIKDAVPDDPQDFGYTVSGTGLTPFSLDDDADPTLSNTQSFTGLGGRDVHGHGRRGVGLDVDQCGGDGGRLVSTMAARPRSTWRRART